MNVAELIAELQKLPPDLKVWVSDGGQNEGALPLKGVQVKQACYAGLDGDEVIDEYEYIQHMENPQEDLSTRGYELTESGNYWTKKIVIVQTNLDR